MLKKILLGVILNALALYVVTLLFTDIQYTGELKFFIIGGVIIGFLNFFVKPIMKLLSFPLVFVTGGLFMVVINTLIFWLTIKIINVIKFSGIMASVEHGLTYFLAAIVFALTNWFIHLLIKNK